VTQPVRTTIDMAYYWYVLQWSLLK